mgnify:CR=1 FL=1
MCHVCGPDGPIDAALAKHLHVRTAEQGIEIEATGLAGHACQPSGTINAIARLAGALSQSGLLTGRDLATAQAIARWTDDPYGTGLGVEFDSEESGPTTVNGGLIMPAGDPRVRLLTETFNDVLDCEAQPVAVGDGTHARFIPRAINFGPEFHAAHVPAIDGIDLETPAFIAPGAGNVHGADEWASLKNLKAVFMIYALGLVRLDETLDASAAS